MVARTFVAATLLWVAANTLADEVSWGFFADPIIPADNALTADKIALGKRLFSETALSATDTYSCASCHQPDRHFTDGLPHAVGATGEHHTRNTPTLYNVAFNASYGWEDLGLTTLEAQHAVPLFNTTPVEMGYDESRLEQLALDETYREDFASAFGNSDGDSGANPELFSTSNVIKALASYVRTITPPLAAFDAYLFDDDKTALTEGAVAGLVLFFSDRLGCAQCHATLNFSGPINHAVQTAPPVFHVTAVGGTNQAFRAPTLRMIKHTAPYMHDGSLTTLAQVVQHYQQIRVERVPEFSLTDKEARQLIAFLESL